MKRRSAMRRHVGRVLRPVSQHLPRVRLAAKIISRNPASGFRLLRDSRAAREIHSDPDIYSFAAYLGQGFECTHLIAIGQPTSKDLIQVHPQFKIIGIVPEANLQQYRQRHSFAEWHSANIVDDLSLPEDVLKRAVIVCQNILMPGVTSNQLLESLRAWLDHAPVCLLTSSGDALNGETETTLEHLLRGAGFNVEFAGMAAGNDSDFEKTTHLAIVTRNEEKRITNPPSDFRVVAFMAAYNEEDIIVESIKKWTDQGVSVHVLENWSTDRTHDLVCQLATHLPVTVERFPQTGPSDYFDWEAMLLRIEELCGEIEADWFVRRGADEVLRSPWPNVSYKEALYLVDQAGYNCVDHTIIEFHPVDEGFQVGMDHEDYFKHYDFKNLSHRFQRKAWKNYGQPISTVPSAGHDVLFAGRRVYPFKFLLKHYAFRSQKHGETKVFRERKARWNPKERARGWHVHYDAIAEGHRFTRSPVEKDIFEEDEFNRTYLVERLSGIGANR